MSHSTMVTRAFQLTFNPMKRRGTPPLVQGLLLLTIMNLKLMRGIIGRWLYSMITEMKRFGVRKVLLSRQTSRVCKILLT